MRLLAGQKPLEIFNVMGLKMTDTDLSVILTSSNMWHLSTDSNVLFSYLLLSLILPEGIPPLHEVGQTQEVNHLSFSIDEGTEDWRISVRTHLYVRHYAVTLLYDPFNKMTGQYRRHRDPSPSLLNYTKQYNVCNISYLDIRVDTHLLGA